MTDEEALKAAQQTAPVPTINPNINTKLPALPTEAVTWLKNFNPGLFDHYEQIQGAWNHPLTQFSVILVRDPAFRGAMSEISTKFEKTTVLGAELGWMIVIWILRAWRISLSKTWLNRIWVQIWVSALFWIGSLLLIPLLLWGKSYQIVITSVFRALLYQL